MDAKPSAKAQESNTGLTSSTAKRPGPWPPRIEPLPADHDHNPRVLRSWARRTGFKSSVSGETIASSEITHAPAPAPASVSSAAGNSSSSLPKQNVVKTEANGSKENQRVKEIPVVATNPPLPSSSKKKNALSSATANGQAVKMENLRVSKDPEADISSYQSQDADNGDELLGKQSHIKYEIRENPGLGKFLPQFCLSFSFYSS